jgi:hypothetical protein
LCAVAELVLAEKVAYLRFANGMTDQPNPMNNSFLNLSLKKSIGQAVGLYLFGLLVLLLANFIVGSIAGTLFGAGFNEGLILGAAVSIAVCPLLAFWILKLKSLLTPLNRVGLDCRSSGSVWWSSSGINSIRLLRDFAAP